MLPSTFVKGFHDEVACLKMKYNELGKTGLKVSVLGFGGSALGGVHAPVTEFDCVQTVHHALSSGINYIDTAPWYGFGKAEEMLAKGLVGIPREAYYVATKIGRYSYEVNKMFDFSAERTIASVDESLQRLGLQYVDIIQVHDLEFAPSLDVIINETLPALQKVKESGKARFIGITGYPVSILKEVLERSTVHIDTVLSYSRAAMFDTTLNNYIPYFESKGVGVIDAAGMGMGLLTNQGPPKWHPASQELKDACANAAAYCREKGVNISALAAFFNLAQPGAATHLISCADVSVIEMNLKTAQDGVSDREKVVMEEVIDRFFKPLQPAHWEGVDVEAYKKKLKDHKNT